MSTGTLRVEVYIAREALPLPGALVEIYNENEWQTGRPPIARLTADESGQTEAVTLNAPDAELSQNPYEGVIPYSTYDIIVQMSASAGGNGADPGETATGTDFTNPGA